MYSNPSYNITALYISFLNFVNWHNRYFTLTLFSHKNVIM